MGNHIIVQNLCTYQVIVQTENTSTRLNAQQYCRVPCGDRFSLISEHKVTLKDNIFNPVLDGPLTYRIKTHGHYYILPYAQNVLQDKKI